MTGNPKASERRLKKMSPPLEVVWSPEFPAEEPKFEYQFVVSENVAYIQCLGFDERGRLTEWVVIQQRRVNGRWQRVAVYDHCHHKGVHVHFYDREENECAEQHVMKIESYKDLERGLDYALERVTENWDDNERRSDRGH